MQVASKSPFPPFAVHASDQQGPFFTLSRSANCQRGVFFTLSRSANCQQGPFSTLSRSANHLRGSFFILSRSANCLRGVFFIVARCANSLRGSFSPLSRCANCLRGPFSTVSRSANCLRGSFFTFSRSANCQRGVRFLLAPLARLLQEVFLPIHQRYLPLETSFFLLFFTPTIAIPYPLSRENHPKIQKKAPFLLFPRHPHCQNPSIPPAWTQGGLATATMPQGEKQESSPWKGGVLYFSRWAIWFYAGGLERSTSSEDQNDCTISSASFDKKGVKENTFPS